MWSVPRMLLVEVLALAACLLHAGPGNADEELYGKVAPATALVFKGPGTFFAGTGFLIDERERLLLTAEHVVANLNGGLAPNISVVFAQSKEGEIITDSNHYRANRESLSIPGKVVYQSVRRDMAVIRLARLPNGIKALKLASRPARPGQVIHIVGNFSERFGAVFSYCHGYVRNVFRYDDLGARVVATQAPTNKGDSGSPTVNGRGEVVGMAFMSTTGSAAPKNNFFHDLQVTALSLCVSEINDGLKEMRERLLARGGKERPSLENTPRAAVHFFFLEKDVFYRISVKANGFVPDLRLDHNLVGRVGGGGELQHLFTPTVSKQYRVQVGPFPGGNLGKGALPYTLTIDEASFTPETAFSPTELKDSDHTHKFEVGKAYEIIVKAKGFEPDVYVVDGKRVVHTAYGTGKRSGGVLESFGLGSSLFETVTRFTAPRTANFRIRVAVSPQWPGRSNNLDYTVRVAEAQVHFTATAQLAATDPIYSGAGPFKLHPVKLVVGKNYQIDLIPTTFDGYLLLEDSAGKAVARGFDIEQLNSRLFFRPTKTDTYRIVATSRQLEARGSYTVVVAETAVGLNR